MQIREFLRDKQAYVYMVTTRNYHLQKLGKLNEVKVFRLMPFVFILEPETDLMKHLKCIVFDMD